MISRSDYFSVGLKKLHWKALKTLSKGKAIASSSVLYIRRKVGPNSLVVTRTESFSKFRWYPVSPNSFKADNRVDSLFPCKLCIAFLLKGVLKIWAHEKSLNLMALLSGLSHTHSLVDQTYWVTNRKRLQVDWNHSTLQKHLCNSN